MRSEADLEDRQSPEVEKRRSEAEGEDAQLTELAAPQVVSETETGEDLEKEESLAKTDTDEGDDAALAEVAAPLPVSHRTTSAQHSPESPFDEDPELDDVPSPSSSKISHMWVEFTTVAWLTFFSLLGTLARLGVKALSTYPNAVVSSTVLWANLGGSFAMGFLLEDRQLFYHALPRHQITDDQDETSQARDKSKKQLPLYIGLTTGFCGSFTSFSTFITDGVLALVHQLAPSDPSLPYHTIAAASIQPRSGGYSFMALVAVCIIHPAVSVGALKTGAHLAVGLESITPKLPIHLTRNVLDPAGVLLGFGCWLGAVILCIWPVAEDWRPRAITALVFAPLGTLSRFYVSRNLNARVPQFPLGTFAINIFGTCVEGVCYDLQHSQSVIGGVMSKAPIPCAILEGVMQGYCGCATTVSTWVVELNSLRRRHAWLYGSASVGIALLLQIAIVGSLAWTAGLDQVCSRN